VSGRVIQGFFVGGRPPSPSVLASHRPATVQRTVAAGARPAPGPPAPAFVGYAAPVQARLTPGRRPLVRPASPVGQAFGCGDSFEIDPEQLGLARSGGQPLPRAILAKMERAFRADFSAVRVHVGLQAPRIGAVAFTMGNDLYFAPGKFQPDSVQGQQLIGHELAHVIQQRQGRVRAPGSGVALVQDRTLEAEADRLGMQAASMAISSPAGNARAVQRLVSATPSRGAAKVARGRRTIQRFKHGFDLLELADDAFKEVFIAVALSGSVRDHTITDYDNYKLLERAQGIAWTDDEVKRLSGRKLANFASAERQFRETVGLADRTDAMVRLRAEFESFRKFKHKKTGELRTLLLGTYIKPGVAGHIVGSLGAFVEQADGDKQTSRKEKWLRIPDEEWTSEVNARWVAMGIEAKRSYKILAPLTAEHRAFLLAAVQGSTTGIRFLQALRDKYQDTRAFGVAATRTQNPLWDDTSDDREAHRPSFLSYEIAELIDAKYRLEEKKGLIRMTPLAVM
jgi:hypothetical protein